MTYYDAYINAWQIHQQKSPTTRLCGLHCSPHIDNQANCNLDCGTLPIHRCMFSWSYAAKGVTEQKKMFEASLSMKIPLLVAFRKGFNEVGFEGAKALNPHSSQLFVVHLFSGNFNQNKKNTHSYLETFLKKHGQSTFLFVKNACLAIQPLPIPTTAP